MTTGSSSSYSSVFSFSFGNLYFFLLCLFIHITIINTLEHYLFAHNITVAFTGRSSITHPPLLTIHCPFQSATDNKRILLVKRRGDDDFMETSNMNVDIILRDPNDWGWASCRIISNRGTINTQFHWRPISSEYGARSYPSKLHMIAHETIRSVLHQHHKLSCPLSRIIPIFSPIEWKRLPQYVIITNNATNELVFQSFKIEDYGTYYCGPISTKGSEQLVARLDILPPALPERKLKLSTASLKTHFIQVNPGQVSKSPCPVSQSELDSITWMTNDNVILLRHSKEYIFDSQEWDNLYKPLFCIVTRFGNPSIYNIAKVVFIQSDNKQNAMFRVHGNFAPGDSVKLDCLPERAFTRQQDEILWLKNGILYHRGNRLTLNKFSESDYGNYTCLSQPKFAKRNQLTEKSNLVQETIALAPTVIGGAQMKMTNPPGTFVFFSEGDRRELHCEIKTDQEGRPIVNSKTVEWTFQGRPLYAARFASEDRHQILSWDTVSILVLSGMNKDNEGTYRCLQSNLEYMTTLQLLQTQVVVHPGVRQAKTDEKVEFHCLISGSDILQSKSTSWSFRPSSGNSKNIEQALPSNALIQGPSITAQSASFIVIDRVLLSNAGEYICRYGQVANFSTLIVTEAGLSVSPKEQRVREGTASVYFICESQDPTRTGKVTWMRADGRGFTPYKETIRSSNDRPFATLTISEIQRIDDNSRYMCLFEGKTEYVTLFVESVCESGSRACQSTRTCIDKALFCDGNRDCEDGSDEDSQNCNDCEPNEARCEDVNGVSTDRRCVLKSWVCDGVDDCRNNYDELSCPAKNTEKCIGPHFECNNGKTIPRSYWCDQEPDCAQAEDEIDCRVPAIIQPLESANRQMTVRSNTTVTLICEASGRPLPTVIWRFNWGHLPAHLVYNITERYQNCDRVINVLTIPLVSEQYAGIYTCEAINRERNMAPDYSISISNVGKVCEPPKFNDAAVTREDCLTCYCSGVSNSCTSVRGYAIASTPRLSSTDTSDFKIQDYTNKKILQIKNRENLFDTFTGNYVVTEELMNDIQSEKLFFTSSFGLNSSWISSYSLSMTTTIKIYSPREENRLSGPLVILTDKSKQRSLYHCRQINEPTEIRSSPSGYSNILSIDLNTRQWFSDSSCSQAVSREYIMSILQSVSQVAFRIRYFSSQTRWEMSPFTLNYLTIDNSVSSDTSTLPTVEQCDCPMGYTGLSCESCSLGYRFDKQGQCSPYCPCDKCYTNGTCMKECEGNRAGPNCMFCEDGTFRRGQNLLTADCESCSCSEMLGTNIKRKCGTLPVVSSGHSCQCQNTQMVSEECRACENGTRFGKDCPKSVSVCSATGSLYESQDNCVCKEGYQGRSCDECNSNYFKSRDRCHSCFCYAAPSTGLCNALPGRYLEPVIINNEQQNFSVTLMRRRLHDLVVDPNEQNLVNLNKDSITVRDPPIDGAFLLFIGLNDQEKWPSNLKFIYGGKIKFRLLYGLLVKDIVKQEQIQPTIEIESLKFGRLWTLASLSDDRTQWEARFREDYWQQWRDASGSPIIDRSVFLRALLTARGVAIGLTKINNRLGDITIASLQLDVARQVDDREARERRLTPAPLEECLCINGATRSNCEGCQNSNRESSIRLGVDLPDFECTYCKANADCGDCNPGDYRYNYLTNDNSPNCLPGLRIESEPRQIIAYEGEDISIPCILRSYGYRAPLHSWSKVGISDDNGRINQTRLPLGKDLTNALMKIKSVRSSDQGTYRCSAFSIFSNVSQDVYLRVISSSSPRLRADVNLISTDKQRQSAVYDIIIDSPNSKQRSWKEDLNIIFRSKSGEILKSTELDSEEGRGKIRIQVDLTPLANRPDELRLIDYLITNNSPYQSESLTGEIETGLEYDSQSSGGGGGYDYNSITLLKDRINIGFLKEDSLIVSNPRNIPVDIVWFKNLDTQQDDGVDRPLPKGTAQSGHNLHFFAATDEHVGRYVAYVRDPKRNDIVYNRLYAHVGVDAMLPMDNNRVSLPNNNSAIHVNVRIPSENYCPNRQWFLIKKFSDESRAIPSSAVTILNDQTVILYIESDPATEKLVMKCFAVPAADSIGRIEFNLANKDVEDDFIVSLRSVPSEGVIYYFQGDNITVLCEARDQITNVLRSDVELSWLSNPTVEWSELADKVDVDFGRLILFSMKSNLPSLQITCRGNSQTKEKSSESFNLIAAFGPEVEIKSSLNLIEEGTNKDLKTVRILEERPLELICSIESIPSANSVQWFLIQDLMTDVPQPRTIISLTDDRVLARLGVNITTNKNKTTSILYADKFLSTNLKGDLICSATSNGKTANSTILTLVQPKTTEVKLVNATASQYNVLEGGNLEFTCVMTDKTSGQIISPVSYTWIFEDINKRKINVSEVAYSDVTETGTTIILKNFSLTNLRDFSGWCSAKYNDTLYDKSDSFNVKIHPRPVIEPIVLKKVLPKPETELLPNDEGIVKYTYNYTEELRIQCNVKFYNATVTSTVWEKCSDIQCSNPISKQKLKDLRFRPKFTDYRDSGYFRCLATARVLNFDPITRFVMLDLERPAKPELKKREDIKTSVGREVSLLCQELNAFPLATFSWQFKAESNGEYGDPPKEARIISRVENRSSELSYSDVQVSHMGMYKCLAENVYGSYESEGLLTVTSGDKKNKKYFAVYY